MPHTEYARSVYQSITVSNENNNIGLSSLGLAAGDNFPFSSEYRHSLVIKISQEVINYLPVSVWSN